MKSEYLMRFQRLAKSSPSGKLEGGRILIEMLVEDEKTTESGLIISSGDSKKTGYDALKTQVGIIVEVGAGYYDPDTKEDVPLNREIGEVVWVTNFGPGKFSTMPGLDVPVIGAELALIDERDIMKSWPSLDAFERDRKSLNKSPGGAE